MSRSKRDAVAREVVRFVCPLPPRALRRNSQTAHVGYRAALVREYQEQVWCAGRGPMWDVTLQTLRHHPWPWEKAHVRLTWRHAGVAPDTDNALASCKALIDVLKATGPRPLGIFRDDSPDCMTVSLTTRKVAHRKDEGIDVEVIRGA